MGFLRLPHYGGRGGGRRAGGAGESRLYGDGRTGARHRPRWVEEVLHHLNN